MRFTEHVYHDPGRLDFVPREYKRQFLRVIVAFTLCLIALLGVGIFDMLRQSNYSLVVSLASLIFMSLYVVVLKQRDIDSLMNTEYQNMLFAQGVGIGASFYLYVRTDGTIAYMNDGLRKLLQSDSVMEAQTMDGLLEYAGVAQVDAMRIIRSINACQADRLVLPMMTHDKARDFVITIDPLRRPAGMMLIRGREYHDARTGMVLMPDILRSTSPEKLDHMLANSPAALYTTDAFGKLEYVSPAFENLLNFERGQMLASGLSLDRIIVSLPHATELDSYRLLNYSGNAKFIRNHGGYVNGTLHQVLLRDAQGKTVGVTGTILSNGSDKG